MTEFPYQNTPPSREKVLDKSMSIVRNKHDTGDKEHERLKQAVKKIVTFGYHPPEEEGCIFQYQEENQGVFWDAILTIIDGSASIEPMVSREKIEQFRAENLLVPPSPLMQQPVMQEGSKKQSGGVFSKFFGEKKDNHNNEPYQIAIPNIFDALRRIKRLDLFIEYQAYGVKHVPKHSFKWANRYRRFHYSRFQFVVAPAIIRKHKQYLENEKGTEKMYSVMMGTANDRIMHQMRMDMLQTKPQQ